jgi:hypothetical protein
MVDLLSLDALFTDSDDPDLREMAAMPGYEWRGLKPSDPYGEPDQFTPSRLLSADMFLGSIERDRPLVRYVWDPDDPLHLLFSVWYGVYGPSDFDQGIAAAFAARATEVTVALGGEVPTTEGVTPAALTATHIAHSGGAFDGFMVLDAADPHGLGRFWTTRACGGEVFPWPVGYGARARVAATAWLNDLRSRGLLHRWRQAGGAQLPAHIGVLPEAPDSIKRDRER